MSSPNNNAKAGVNITSVIRLSVDVDLSNFDCSQDDILGLNEFIHNEALEYQQTGMGVTYLFYNKDKLVGYITVAMSSIKDKFTSVHVEGYPDIYYPALNLGRLAIDNSERHKGYGHILVDYCIKLALEKAVSEVGCRFIVLVTKEDYRVNFYKQHGFKLINKLKLDNDFKMMYFQLF